MVWKYQLEFENKIIMTTRWMGFEKKKAKASRRSECSGIMDDKRRI